MKGLTLKPIVTAVSLAIALSACSSSDSSLALNSAQSNAEHQNTAVSQHAHNPFFKPYDTFFGIPDFDKIKPEHYLPAFEAGIAEQKLQITNIAQNPQPATFANTIEAMEFSGDL